MTERLRDLEVVEVSFVDHAANQRKYLLLKSLGGSPVSQDKLSGLIKLALETKGEDEAAFDAAIQAHNLDEESAGAVRAAYRILNAHSDALPEDVLKALAPTFGLAVEKKDGGQPNQPDLSDLPPDVRQKVEAVWEQAEKERQARENLEKRLAKIEDERETRTFVEKARGFSHLPADPEKLGTLLKDARSKLGDERYRDLEEMLKSLDAQAKESAIFAERGSATPVGAGSAHAKIDSLVTKAREANPKLDYNDAVTKVLAENPALATEYMQQDEG